MKRSREAIKRLALEILGWSLVVLGIIAMPLPGPGLLILFVGLLVLSQQYEWAEKRVEPVRRAALKGAYDGVQTWPRIVLSLLGVVWLCFIGTVWLMQPPAPSWWPVDDRFWLFGGPWTGVTLIGSGMVALAIIGYSFVKYRGAETPPHLQRPEPVEAER